MNSAETEEEEGYEAPRRGMPDLSAIQGPDEEKKSHRNLIKAVLGVAVLLIAIGIVYGALISPQSIGIVSSTTMKSNGTMNLSGTTIPSTTSILYSTAGCGALVTVYQYMYDNCTPFSVSLQSVATQAIGPQQAVLYVYYEGFLLNTTYVAAGQTVNVSHADYTLDIFVNGTFIGTTRPDWATIRLNAK